MPRAMSEYQWKRFNEIEKKLIDCAMEFENNGLLGAAEKTYALVDELEQTENQWLRSVKPK